MQYTAKAAGLKRKVIGLNDTLSRIQALALEHVPGKPFSHDNYLSLRKDSVCVENGLQRLGITPTALEAIVPTYLGDQNRPGRYQNFRASAGRG